MNCPNCSCGLREVKSSGVTVDVCSNCKGIWFDSGGLSDFVRSLTESEAISPQTPHLFRRAVQPPDSAEEKQKVCPRCGQQLHRFNYCYDSNVFLDKCSRCHGIWADGGQVEQAARYLKEDPRMRAVSEVMLEFHQPDQTLKDLAGYPISRALSAVIACGYLLGAYAAHGIRLCVAELVRLFLPLAALSKTRR